MSKLYFLIVLFVLFSALAAHSTQIDISDLDRDTLLEALWQRSKPGRFFAPFDLREAKKQLWDGYADYICGRVIKTDIYSEDTVDPSMYDRDNGAGAFQSVVDKMRREL
uniref:Uncharacterized protein n=1 Tax=viral metagenome TaxID=1070528 RepID=A0A6C0CAZ2_9ZZZZ